jgi:ribosomal protein S18 acetylase RimI-like enzyme
MRPLVATVHDFEVNTRPVQDRRGNLSLRTATPSDYEWIIEVADVWWGRPIASALPRLYLDHFYRTSVIAESADKHVGFLVGFLSPGELLAGYIHFVGVDPSHRQREVGRTLYEHFFALAREAGRNEVRAITSSQNQGSIRFHRSLGFSVSAPLPNYNGPNTAPVMFHRAI